MLPQHTTHFPQIAYELDNAKMPDFEENGMDESYIKAINFHIAIEINRIE
jgi:hypothetical protein